MLNIQQIRYINMLKVHFTQSQDIYAYYFFYFSISINASGFNRYVFKNMKKSQGFISLLKHCLLDRNTQLNKYLRISHCKTHENCWIINVEKLTSVLSDFQMKKVSHFFILNCTKNPSFLFI